MLLADYSGRLAAEIDDRRQLTRTLTVFLQSQKDGLAQNEQKLEVRKSFLPSSCLVACVCVCFKCVCLCGGPTSIYIMFLSVLTCVETPTCLIAVSLQVRQATDVSVFCC